MLAVTSIDTQCVNQEVDGMNIEERSTSESQPDENKLIAERREKLRALLPRRSAQLTLRPGPPGADGPTVVATVTLVAPGVLRLEA